MAKRFQTIAPAMYKTTCMQGQASSIHLPKNSLAAYLPRAEWKRYSNEGDHDGCVKLIFRFDLASPGDNVHRSGKRMTQAAHRDRPDLVPRAILQDVPCCSCSQNPSQHSSCKSMLQGFALRGSSFIAPPKFAKESLIASGSSTEQ